MMCTFTSTTFVSVSFEQQLWFSVIMAIFVVLAVFALPIKLSICVQIAFHVHLDNRSSLEPMDGI